MSTTQKINYYKTLSNLKNSNNYFSDPVNPVNPVEINILIPEHRTEDIEEHIDIIVTKPPNNTTDDPTNYWGPQLWFTLHNSSRHYPIHASPLYAERMKQFINALPIIIPCESCRDHANGFIKKHKEYLSIICSGRESLFNFFVDFHNYVNNMKGKKIYTYEEALELYK